MGLRKDIESSWFTLSYARLAMPLIMEEKVVELLDCVIHCLIVKEILHDFGGYENNKWNSSLIGI